MRKIVGVLGPALFFLLLCFPLPGLSSQAAKLLAIFVWVMLYWMTEAIPLWWTALGGVALAVLLGVASPVGVVSPLFHPLLLLFFASFLIAQAIKVHHLDRRVTHFLFSVPALMARPSLFLFALGSVAVLFSLWMSNTAVTAMLYPLILGFIFNLPEEKRRDLGSICLLMLAYAASIGGMGTPMGTLPNLIGLRIIQETVGLKIYFWQWMLFAFPIVALAFLCVYFILARALPTGAFSLAGTEEAREGERGMNLPPWTREERLVFLVFALAIFFWVLPVFPEYWGGVCLILLLLFLPIRFKPLGFLLPFSEVRKIDWGVLVLFGGGVALGSLAFTTGLAKNLGEGLIHATGVSSLWGVTGLVTLLGILVSELTSNTASANMVIPLAIGVAQAAGISPLAPALGACLGSSLGFMLPVSTPPNAIVYGSGLIPLTKMIRIGIMVDVVGFFVIWGGLRLLLPLFGLLNS